MKSVRGALVEKEAEETVKQALLPALLLTAAPEVKASNSCLLS